MSSSLSLSLLLCVSRSLILSPFCALSSVPHLSLSLYPYLSLVSSSWMSVSGSDAGFHFQGDPGRAAMYTGAGCFAAASLAFFVSAVLARTEKIRDMSVNSLLIVATAGTAYLLMAFGYGSTVVDGTREIFYARYVDWAITTPLLLWDLSKLAGVPFSTTKLLLGLDELMILLGLFAALEADEHHKWPLFALSCVAFVPIVGALIVSYPRHLNPEVRSAYTFQTGLLVFLWMMYPIAWGLGDGSWVISSDAQTIFILILDVIAKAVYGSILLSMWRSVLPYSDGDVADVPTGIRKQPEQLIEPLSPGGSRRIITRPGGVFGWGARSLYAPLAGAGVAEQFNSKEMDAVQQHHAGKEMV